MTTEGEPWAGSAGVMKRLPVASAAVDVADPNHETEFVPLTAVSDVDAPLHSDWFADGVVFTGCATAGMAVCVYTDTVGEPPASACAMV